MIQRGAPTADSATVALTSGGLPTLGRDAKSDLGRPWVCLASRSAASAPAAVACVRMASRPPIEALTGLRWIAATWVVLYHFGPHLGDSLWWPLEGVRVIGDCAVGLFFVLSGFVLSYRYAQEEPRTALALYARARAGRLLPAYALSMLLAAPVDLGIGTPLAVWLCAFVMLQPWLPLIALLSNFPAWSVGVEAFFYTTFPWISAALGRQGRRGLWAVALCAIALKALAAGALGALLYADGTLAMSGRDAVRNLWVMSFHVFPPARLPEFVLGVATGRLWLSGWHPPKAAVAVAPVLLAGLAICVGPARLDMPLVSLVLMPTLLAPVWALLVASLASAPAGGILASAPLRKLGDASYGVYIYQYPLFGFWRALVPGPVEMGPREILVWLLVLNGFALLSVRWLEGPLRARIARSTRA